MPNTATCRSWELHPEPARLLPDFGNPRSPEGALGERWPRQAIPRCGAGGKLPSEGGGSGRFTAVGAVRRGLGAPRVASVLDQIRRAETTILLAGCYPGSPSGLCRKLVRFVQKTALNQRKARLVGTQLHSALQDNRWHAQLTL